MKVNPIVKYLLIGLVAATGIGIFIFNRFSEKGEITALDIFAAIFTTIVYSVVIVLMFSRRNSQSSDSNSPAGSASNPPSENKKDHSSSNTNQVSQKDINRLSQ